MDINRKTVKRDEDPNSVKNLLKRVEQLEKDQIKNAAALDILNVKAGLKNE